MAFETLNMDAPLLEYEVQIPEGFQPNNKRANRNESTSYVNNWNYVADETRASCHLIA